MEKTINAQNVAKKAKQPWQTPRLTIYGNVEEITGLFSLKHGWVCKKSGCSDAAVWTGGENISWALH